MSTALTFLGAAGTVTGSKYLLTVDGRRLLVDAGMFQGDKQWRRRNWDEFPVPADTISDVLLTHAHADHCAYLPALVAQGFDGPVWCTDGTAKLAAIVMRDAAFLAEREAQEAAAGGWSKHDPPVPIYTLDDAERAIRLLTTVDFDRELDLDDGISAVFTRAGHILGSSSITMTTPTTSVIFSGDLGRHDHPVLRPGVPPPGAPYVVIESTYGDREHPDPVNLPHEALADAIRRTVSRGGSVLIPAFAIDRTEIVLKVLGEMIAQKRIPRVPIYVNSPMASAALDVYRRAGEELADGVSGDDFARIPGLEIITSPEDSRRLTEGRHSPRIIVTSSGMASGGRVIHHLRAMLPHERDTVVLTGYQGVGTRGRMLLDGVDKMKFQGEYVPVRAEIVDDGEFSVHADASDLEDWLRALTPRPRTVFVTHGEAKSAQALARRLQRDLGVTPVVPAYGEVVVLTDGGEVAEPTLAPSVEVTPTVVGDDRVVGEGARVTSDLHVREHTPTRIVLDGTITIDLPAPEPQ